MEEFNRRITDGEGGDYRQCPMFKDKNLIEQIHNDLKDIKDEVAKMTELMAAWDNAKGFVKTIRVIGELTKWVVAVGAAITAIWWWVRR